MDASFKLEARLGNAAFADLPDVAAALRGVADDLDDGCESGIIRDENGNTVGRWEVAS